MDNPGKIGTPGMPSRDSTLINKYVHEDLRPVSVKETPKPGCLTAHDPMATSSQSSSPLLGTWAEPTRTGHRQGWGVGEPGCVSPALSRLARADSHGAGLPSATRGKAELSAWGISSLKSHWPKSQGHRVKR